MKKYLAFLFCILSFTLLVGCGAQAEIEAGQAYYARELRISAFHYADTGAAVKLQRFDQSFAQFNEDFTIFSIHFYLQDKDTHELPQYWVISKFKRKRGNITCEMSRIENGKIKHYDLATDENSIYLNTEVTYTIATDTEDEEVTIVRNTTVAIFSRTIPEYIANMEAGG